MIEALKAERLADLTKLAMSESTKDYAWGHAKQMAAASPYFFGDMPALLTASASVAKAQTQTQTQTQTAARVAVAEKQKVSP